MPAPAVTDYLDFRDFLRDAYLARKATHKEFTHRFIAQQIDCSSGFFTLVLQGKSNISPRIVEGLASLFGLEGKQADYFRTLVRFNQAKSFGARREAFEELFAQSGETVRQTETAQHRFYSAWHHSAIRELLALRPYRGDSKELARQVYPPITEAQARKSIELLLELGLAERDAEGNCVRRDAVITTGPDAQSVAIGTFAEQTLELARNALVNLPRSQRDISSVTLSLSERGLAEVRERLAHLRQEVLEIARRDEGVDRVVQLNLQCFPLSRPLKESDE